MASYVFTEAIMAVVFSYCVNFIEKTGFQHLSATSE